MHVLFIWPNLNAEEGFSHGVACLSGVLKARGHRTSLINLNEAYGVVPTHEQIIEQVRALRPDLLAFSVMSQQYPYSLGLARAIRAALPGVPIAIGGVHTTMCTQQVVEDGRRYSVWDFIGVGECDEALAGLVERIERQKTGDRRQETGDRRQETGDRRQETGDRRQEAGDRRQETGDRRQETEGRRQKTGDRRQETGDRRQETEVRRREAGEGGQGTTGEGYLPPAAVREIPNFFVRLADGSYHRNPLGRYPDLNSLPAEDYEVFDLKGMLAQKNGWQSVLTSRGCPYRCSYCLNHEVSDRYLREAGEHAAGVSAAV